MRPLITLSYRKSPVDFPCRWGVRVHGLTKRPAKVISSTDRFSIPPFPSSLQQASFPSFLSHSHAALSSPDMDLVVLLVSPQGRQSSCRVGACRCDFLPSSRSSFTLPFVWIKGFVAFPRGFPTRLSHEAFPRGFPTGLSYVPPWCESILGLKVEAVQGEQVSLEWAETSGGLWEWWHDPEVPLAFPVESASS